ncbi:hypothetical protein [Halomonas sp. H10-9-1]|uniref:hypothetical protein n=1 Tax=Halomonas sp. H10-9-1 TaxID=2950871 RepID=UPI0032DFC3EA
MTLRPLLVAMLAVWLAGCELLPAVPFELPSGRTTSETAAAANGCRAELPSFADDDCLLPEWVAFGLASQRGDRAWREAMLTRLEGAAAERRLARAVALSWGSQGQWDHASELYKADLSAAPVALQPLLRYWLNELEGRRAMAGRLSAAQSAQAQSEALSASLKEENADLEKKLEALTAIERSINLRQQTEE